MAIEIPLKAKNDEEFTTLSKIEKDIIVYSVLYRVDNQIAFLRYNPQYAIAVGRPDKKGFSKLSLNEAGKKACKQMWGYGKVKDYKQAYEETLDEFFGLCKRVGSNTDPSEELSEERKDSALKSLLNKALALVEKGGELDPDTLKTIADLFKRLGVLKDEVETVESPRRYLPTRCHSECQYRLFCEKAIENGEIENECLYCKALAIAQEHGYKYDPTTNLSIPQKDA